MHIRNTFTIFLFLLICVFIISCSDEQKKTNPYVGDMYDTSYAGQITPSRTKQRLSASGNEIIINEFSGKFVWNDFAAPWCSPCIPQAQVIKRLEAAYPDKVVFITVMTSKSSKYSDLPDQQTAQDWSRRFGLNPAHVLVATDLWARVVPTHFFYSPEGQTLFEYKGGMSETQIRQVIDRYTTDWRAWKKSGAHTSWMR